MKVAYIGFGVLGYQMKSFIDAIHQPQKSIYFDDLLYQNGNADAHPFARFSEKEFSDFSFYVCLGYRHLPLKKQIVQQMLNMGRKLPSFVHPTVYVSPSSTIEPACFLYPGSNIDMEVTIHKGSLINNSVVISHNCKIGEAAYLSPGIVISGNVSLGDCCFLGSGSIVSNNLEIGDGCTIGIGSVITRSLPPKTHGIGNPFHIFDIHLK